MTAAVADPRLAAAYAECERITRTEAGNFAWGIRLLPGDRRRALSAVYALARRIDDIGDSTGPVGIRSRQLAAVRAEVGAVAAAGPDRSAWPWRDPVLLAVADAAERTGLPLEEFGRLVDGCQADLAGMRYPTFEALAGYTRQVAGSIGRLSVAVFGVGSGSTPSDVGSGSGGARSGSGDAGQVGPLADALGTALQLTNIVRDLLEDARNGRVYLPGEDLARFGCTLALDADGWFADDADALVALVCWELARAAEWFDVGEQLLPLLNRRARACCAAMAGIYRVLMQQMAAYPGSVLTGRTSVPDTRKALIALRSVGSSWRPAVRMPTRAPG